MKMDIQKIASILDDHIEKAEKKAQPSALKKALSFNPFNPSEMDYDSPYYNPYIPHSDGGFIPAPAEYWKAQGKVIENGNYDTTRQFYAMIGEAQRPVQQAIQSYSRFAKSFDSLLKADAVPVGHVHTYKDGLKYKKTGVGMWEPVKAGPQHHLKHKDEKKRVQANQELELHASKTHTINNVINKKKDTEKLTHETKKLVLRHVREVVSKLFDGPLPEELKGHFDLRRKAPGKS